MVDVWMLFSLVLPFMDVVLQTYSYLLIQEMEGNEDEDKIDMRNAKVRVGVATLSFAKKKNINKR
jgi:hypothetical protein